MIENIYAVWVYVRDLGESRRFYEDALGLEVRPQDGDWIEFDTGETAFALLHRKPEDGPVTPQKTHIMFRVVSIDDAKARLEEHGVRIIGDIRCEPYGTLLTFEDPNGHWLELFEPAE